MGDGVSKGSHRQLISSAIPARLNLCSVYHIFTGRTRGLPVRLEKWQKITFVILPKFFVNIVRALNKEEKEMQIPFDGPEAAEQVEKA